MINWRHIINDTIIALRGSKIRWFLVLGAAIFFIGFISLVFFSDDTQAFSTKEIRINAGMGLSEIATLLRNEGLIRSPFLFKVTALVALRADRLRPGKYLIRTPSSYRTLLNILVRGGDEEVTVVIPEGATIFDIDALLAEREVIKPGELLAFSAKGAALSEPRLWRGSASVGNQSQGYEGYLFPDTYRFLTNSGAETAVTKMLKVFEEKAAPLFSGNEHDRYETLILASLLEKEIPNFKDRQLVAGILKKRLHNDWLLQIDAAICYAKKPAPCYPLQDLDFKINSPYNTYVYQGLPPSPIGNPGLEAIQAALTPKDSSYWYYLSDPHTKKTMYARTLEEQALNKARYLR